MSYAATFPVLSASDFLKQIYAQSQVQQRSYGAMYSTWIGGIVKDVPLMLVPVDDHIVHRGDGVFEAFRIVKGAFYELDAHLQRLQRSAHAVGIPLPKTPPEIVDICRATARVAGGQEGLVRLFVSRGPGGFTTNPYESIGSQLYIVVTPFVRPPAEKYEQGARARRSEVAVKDAPYCGIKSCNYLPNVMMKKEAVDWQVDYTLSVDAEGGLVEGSTENFFIVNPQRELIAPLFLRTLRGTTLLRCMSLAQQLIETGELRNIRQDKIGVEDLAQALEVNLVGTTIEVMPLVQFNGQAIGNGKPGAVGKRIRELLVADMTENPKVRTEVLIP